MEYTYGWENFDPYSPGFRETVLLGTFNAIQAGLEVSDVHSGSNALWISEDGETATAQGFVAWITDLQPQDEITVSCFAKSYAGQEGGGVRMWAHYTYDDENITSYAGSASGNDTYSTPDEWTELSKTWVLPYATYTDGQGIEHPITGLVIEVRPYSAVGEGGFVDDLTVVVPETATVAFPDPTGPAICVGGLPQWDLDNDCKVSLSDFTIIAESWLQCNLQPSADCGL